MIGVAVAVNQSSSLLQQLARIVITSSSPTALSLGNSFVEKHKPLWPPKATSDYSSTSAPPIHHLTKPALSKMFGQGGLDRIKLANMARLAQRQRDAELQAGDPQANQAEGHQSQNNQTLDSISGLTNHLWTQYVHALNISVQAPQTYNFPVPRHQPHLLYGLEGQDLPSFNPMSGYILPYRPTMYQAQYPQSGIQGQHAHSFYPAFTSNQETIYSSCGYIFS